MNQDFALLATPANARRLLLFQSICPMIVPDDIQQLALQDALREQDFDPLVCPHSIIKQTISQFLLDCQLRGIVQISYHPEYNRIALLHAVKLAKPTMITIIASTPSRWDTAIHALSMGGITRVLRGFSLTAAEIDQHRAHMVIIVDADMTIFKSNLWAYSREFVRTIVFEQGEEATQTHWAGWAHLLFPAMPHPLYLRMVQNVPEAWKRQRLADFAPFYNTCIFTHLITDSLILEQCEDRHAIKRLSYRRGLLIS